MTSTDRIARATERAAADAAGEGRSPAAPDPGPAAHVVVGDPQCPLPRYLEVLDRHGLLGGDGCLRAGVRLISIGDHFDFGGLEVWEQAAQDGWHLLAWLAAHPPEQVVILAGNHDLARIGELAGIDPERHRAALAAAQEVYADGETDSAREPGFLEAFPEYPTAQVCARDLACFRPEQRELVLRLLRTQRMRVAEPLGYRVLVLHAGVAQDHLAYLGLPPEAWTDTDRVAGSLNRALAEAVAAWDGGALDIPGLYRPGAAATGEGGGIFYHRPAHPDRVPEDPPLDEVTPETPPARRRVFDATRLPIGLTQVVGHVRDYRCRDLLEPWAIPEIAGDGPLRHLDWDGTIGTYAPGSPGPGSEAVARVVFTDVGLNYGEPADLQILDAVSLRPYRPQA
jgi:hypothetical protein